MRRNWRQFLASLSKATTALRDYRPFETSLVETPALGRRFLVIKSEGGEIQMDRKQLAAFFTAMGLDASKLTEEEQVDVAKGLMLVQKAQGDEEGDEGDDTENVGALKAVVDAFKAAIERLAPVKKSADGTEENEPADDEPVEDPRFAELAKQHAELREQMATERTEALVSKALGELDTAVAAGRLTAGTQEGIAPIVRYLAESDAVLVVKSKDGDENHSMASMLVECVAKRESALAPMLQEIGEVGRAPGKADAWEGFKRETVASGNGDDDK